MKAIVPIKLQSERVPNKNFREFNGKPLFYWIINTLKKVEEIDEIIITMNHETVFTKVSKYFDNINYILRPEELRNDNVTANALIENVLEQTKGKKFLYTHTTNPLLTKETVKQSIQDFENLYPAYDSLLAVTKLLIRAYDESKRPINHNPRNIIQTQDLVPIYEDNSHLYIFSRETFNMHGRVGDNPYFAIMNKRDAVDIDEEEDFILAELLHKKINEGEQS